MRLMLGLLCLLPGASAIANDTMAAVGAGGLEIRQSGAIDMLSEDLFISASRVRVRYEFKNQTSNNVVAIVAFPMPDRDLTREFGGDVAYPSNFRTSVDGKKVQALLERKAVVAGRDYRELLEQLGIPVAPSSVSHAIAAMDRLPPSQRSRLIELRLAGEEEWDDDGSGMKKHLIPVWTVKDIWWWRQRFPAKRIVKVEHGYRPGVGGSVDTPVRKTPYRNASELRLMAKRYCIDDAFTKAIGQAETRHPGRPMPEKRVDYILSTGANWRSPIRRFRLVVDKGRPDNLISFCGEGVRKISPTRFEMRKTDWRPTGDLNILIVEPAAAR